MIGTTLDKYEVLQKVGEGGMATVYRGRHVTLGRDVAIKVLHPHLSSSSRNRKRFAREAKAIEHLHHPNILEIFDYSGEDAEECYIVTEFVQGRTLTEVLQRAGRVPSEVATIIGLDLARALAVAHRAGILHRDIKTDNVMLRNDGVIKLMDFGIARFLDEAQVTMTGALVGSPAFMSPEQAREEDLDGRTDLFSLGTVLFYLVTGHMPFSGSNPSVLLKNIIEGNRPAVTELCPTLSATLADVVERLLQRDREARFDAASQVIEALSLALAEVQVDPTVSEWRLGGWIDDPSGYERRLNEHLQRVLYERGSELLGAEDTLTALRLLNRLMSMDEDNERVLALVQGLPPDAPPAPVAARVSATSWWPLSVAAVGLAVVGGGVTWAVAQPELSAVAPPRPPAVAVASPVPPTPVAAPSIVPATPDEGDKPAAVMHVASPSKGNERARVPLASPDVGARTSAPMPVSSALAQPVPETGTLIIPSTAPNDGELQCEGQRLGKTKQRLAVTLRAGTYNCSVGNPGLFEEERFRVDLTPGGVVEQRVSLRPLPAALDMTCEPACELTVDGLAIGPLSGLSPVADRTFRYMLAQPDERHRIEIRCPGREALSQSLPPNIKQFVRCPQ